MVNTSYKIIFTSLNLQPIIYYNSFIMIEIITLQQIDRLFKEWKVYVWLHKPCNSIDTKQNFVVSYILDLQNSYWTGENLQILLLRFYLVEMTEVVVSGLL